MFLLILDSNSLYFKRSLFLTDLWLPRTSTSEHILASANTLMCLTDLINGVWLRSIGFTEEGRLHIHFDNWDDNEVSTRLTQIIDFGSPRLEHFRSRTIGYTGSGYFKSLPSL